MGLVALGCLLFQQRVEPVVGDLSDFFLLPLARNFRAVSLLCLQNHTAVSVISKLFFSHDCESQFNTDNGVAATGNLPLTSSNGELPHQHNESPSRPPRIHNIHS
jgi:hypothetical protein